MGTITKVEKQKRNPSRVSVYVDGEFYAGMDAVTAVKYRLREGAVVSDVELSEILRSSESASAFECATAFVSYRERTAREIRRKLAEKGYAPETIDETMTKLAEYGLADDGKFCRDYVAAYGGKLGRNMIRKKLMGLGADRDAIDEALASLSGQADAAYALAEKYLRTHRGAAEPKLRHHLYAHGFDSDDISEAVERVKEEYDLAEDDEI